MVSGNNQLLWVFVILEPLQISGLQTSLLKVVPETYRHFATMQWMGWKMCLIKTRQRV